MNVIIIAGGQATRLAPLTDRIPKPLLPLGGKPILEHLYDKLLPVTSAKAVHVLSNDRWFTTFRAWADSKPRPLPVHVHNNADGTNFDRSGTVAGVAWIIRHASLGDRPILSLTGDSYVDYALTDFVSATETRPDATWLALHPTTDPAMVYDSVELAADGRVISFRGPEATTEHRLVRTGVMRLAAEHVPYLFSYLDAGHPVAKGGVFTRYLHEREPVFGRAMAGAWIDAGTPPELLAADNAVRARMGLPTRDVYVAE